jgi:hypothetical protein
MKFDVVKDKTLKVFNIIIKYLNIVINYLVIGFNKLSELINRLVSLFKKTKLFSTVEDLYQDMLDKTNDYYNHKIDKYVVSYDVIDDEHIQVKSNIGRIRMVENNKENIKKLNRVVVRSKVEIARKIDAYESESSIRLTILLSSIIMLTISFVCVMGSLFMGSYLMLLSSMIVFAVVVSLATVQGLNLYILNKEIYSLKGITGYKKENEIEIPKLLKKVN